MKKFCIAFVLAIFMFSIFCGCSKGETKKGTSSYVDIDQFEDDGENIIPSTPNASVTIPSEWTDN